MPRNFGRTRLVRGKRRATFWGRSPADTAPTALAAATAVLDSTSVPLVQGETIVRCRGQIIVGSDQQAANEAWVGAVGAFVATNQAVAVGVGSLPTPYTDQDSELFFMHQYFGNFFRFGTAVGLESMSMMKFEFDSKAMRKIQSGETLCFVVENGAAAAGLEYWLQYSVLFKVA